MSAFEIISDLPFESNERIVHELKPDSKLRLRKNEWFKIPFAIIWTCLMVFIFYGFSNDISGNVNLIYFVGVIVFIIGIYLTIGRILVRQTRNQAVRYLITSKRLIFINDANGRIKYLNFDEISRISTGKYNSEFGYIIFGKPEEIIEGRGVNFTEDEYKFDNIRKPRFIRGEIERLKSMTALNSK